MVSTRGVRYKFSEGERVLCYEPDPTKAKVLYDSKVLEVIENKDKRGRRTIEYLIHFQGWNSSWDRCVGEDFVLKDTEENRQLQRDLAEKSQLQLGAYLYRRERKKGSTSGSAGSSAAKRSRHRFSDDGSSSSTQPDEPENEEAIGGVPEADAENSQESPAEQIKQEVESDSSESSENEPRAQAGSHGDHAPAPVGRAHITMPAVLRDRLTFDYHLIVKRNRLARLPASPCAAQILESFVKWFARAGAWHTPRCRNEPPQKPDLADVSRRLNLVREVADGMRVYFDFIMRSSLLYKPELMQYHQVCGQFLDQQERKMKEELESDGPSQDEYEDENASAEEDMKSPKIPEYSHLPPDPIQAPDIQNGEIMDVNQIKREIKEEPEDIDEDNEMTEEIDSELQEEMQEAMQQEMQEGMDQEEMPEDEVMQQHIKEEIEDQDEYQEESHDDYQEESHEDLHDDTQPERLTTTIKEELQNEVKEELLQVIKQEVEDEVKEVVKEELEEMSHEKMSHDKESHEKMSRDKESHDKITHEVSHKKVSYEKVSLEKVSHTKEKEQVEKKNTPDNKAETKTEKQELKDIKDAIVKTQEAEIKIKQEQEDSNDSNNTQAAPVEQEKLTEHKSNEGQTTNEPIEQATTVEHSQTEVHRELRSHTSESHSREGLRSHVTETHNIREGLRSQSLEGLTRERLRSQSSEGHHSPRSPVVEDTFANTVRRELHRPNTRSRRGNNSPAVGNTSSASDKGNNSPNIQRGNKSPSVQRGNKSPSVHRSNNSPGTHRSNNSPSVQGENSSPAIEDFPDRVEDPHSFANTIRNQINRPATRGQRRRWNSPATPPVTEEAHSSSVASTEAPIITEIKQEPGVEACRPATRTRTRSGNRRSINSPAASPAVSSQAVETHVVDSPAVNLGVPSEGGESLKSPEEHLITEIKQEPRDSETSRPATRSGNVARRLRSHKSAVSQSENEEPQPSTSTAEPRNFEHSSSVGSGSGSSNEEWSKPAEAVVPSTSTRTPLSLLLDKVSKYEIIPREGTEHLPCRVYGAIHLARLFVRLPDFLNATQMSDFKLKLVVKHIDMFIQYLVEHKEWFGEKYYYCDSMSRST